ncbi:MAG: flavin-containing monooxygenase [Dehalococcoidia bacterium]
MLTAIKPEHFDTIVIGAGQAGLSVGYHLQRLGREFVILDANERVGDVWRNRWDSLRLFTPARYDSIDGMKVPAGNRDFITKDEMADYLESYAAHFKLPVRTGVHVDRLSQVDGRYEVRAGERTFTSNQVVVAMGNYQRPNIPSFATRLNPDIVQLHSLEYRNPGQLQEGGVLIVGAGNSGAEIAKEVSKTHATWLSGRDVGQIPFNIKTSLAHMLLTPLVIRGIFYRVLTMKTPFGRKMRPKVLAEGGPLIRVKRKELADLGVQMAGRTEGVEGGLPVLADGQPLDVRNVIWCTGFRTGFDSWIDLPVLGEHEPKHYRGVAQDQPGLYFVGLEFLYSLSSTMVHGVGRDARYIAEHIAKQAKTGTPERTMAAARG